MCVCVRLCGADYEKSGPLEGPWAGCVVLGGRLGMCTCSGNVCACAHVKKMLTLARRNNSPRSYV